MLASQEGLCSMELVNTSGRIKWKTGTELKGKNKNIYSAVFERCQERTLGELDMTLIEFK
jgi:hypothetical protein